MVSTAWNLRIKKSEIREFVAPKKHIFRFYTL